MDNWSGYGKSKKCIMGTLRGTQMDIKLSNMCQIDLGDIVRYMDNHTSSFSCPLLWCSQRRTGIPTKRYYPQAFDGRGTYCEPRTLSELNAYIHSQDKKQGYTPKINSFTARGEGRS